MHSITSTTKSNKSNMLELSSSDERKIFALQILGDKTRYKIFKLLMNSDEMCVSEIASELGVTTSAISQHFRNFEIIGLVDKVRIGQKICYQLKLNDDLVKKLMDITSE